MEKPMHVDYEAQGVTARMWEYLYSDDVRSAIGERKKMEQPETHSSTWPFAHGPVQPWGLKVVGRLHELTH